MNLWMQWYQLVRPLQGSCSRRATFVCLVLVLLGFTLRWENLGVSGLMRGGGFRGPLYRRLLHFFTASRAVSLDRLTRLWIALVLRCFSPLTVRGRLVVLGDGIKAPKEGRKMPGVKSLHQESALNSKPPFIMGHYFQSLSLVVRGVAGRAAAVALLARIHQGLKGTPRDRRTLPERLVRMLVEVAGRMPRPVYLVTDAYYARGEVMRILRRHRHHLITRGKSNTVAFRKPEAPRPRKRGRPKRYGERVALWSLFDTARDFVNAPNPLPGRASSRLEYRAEILRWKPVGHSVLFVWVKLANGERLLLISTDVTLTALEVIKLYGRRPLIEAGYKEAIHTLGAFAYRFWLKAMTPRRRGQGEEYLHRKSRPYREAAARKLEAYHRYVQCALVAQGLMQYLARSGPTRRRSLAICAAGTAPWIARRRLRCRWWPVPCGRGCGNFAGRLRGITACEKSWRKIGTRSKCTNFNGRRESPRCGLPLKTWDSPILT